MTPVAAVALATATNVAHDTTAAVKGVSESAAAADGKMIEAIASRSAERAFIVERAEF